MEQVIVGGYDDSLSQAATEYNCLMGGRYWWAVESWHYQCMPTGGTIKDLFIKLDANVAVASTFTFTLMLNGAPTALTVTIGAGASTGSDVNPAHAVDVVAGQTVSIRSTFTGTPGTPSCFWTTKFTGTIAGESIILMNRCTDDDESVYGEVVGKGYYVLLAAEAKIQAPVPTPGVFKKLYVKLPIDPGTDPDAYSFTLRKDGVNTTLTCTITADNTTCNNIVNTVAFAAGDLVSLVIAPLNTPSAMPDSAIGMVFLADTDGESIIFGGCGNIYPSNDSDEYLNLCGAGYASWWWNEAGMSSLIQACTLKRFYVQLSTDPSAGDSYTISVNVEGGATGITVTIADAATSGNDVVNTFNPANGNVTVIKSVPFSNPDKAYVHTGLVCYIAPAAPGWTGKISGVTNPAKIMGVPVANIAKVKGVA